MTNSADKLVSDNAPGRAKKRQWNYQPDLPIQVSPLFSGSFRPKAILKWFIGGWFPASENLVILMLSIISWFFFHPALGTFHHQMHHRFFECNYGGLEIPCDKWAGSFHDGTPESHQQFLEKRKLKAQQAHG